VLELLEGETLKSHLRQRGALDQEQLLDWSVQIADALDAAHRKGILHRDLKPDNLWVGRGGHIKVLDFGLARLGSDTGGETETVLTSPGQAMGTVPYMSPEQARGGTLDARSDIFSFGSVFYEMVSGRAAFPAANAADSIAAVLRGQQPKLSQLRPGLSPLVEQVAERCLEKDPELRYQSAADLRADLKRLKRESGTASTAAADLPRTRRWWPAVTVLVAAAGVFTWFLQRPSAAASPHLQFSQLTFSGNVVDAVISPDGKFLAHVDNGPQGTSLHLLSISSGSDVQIVPPEPGCCVSPSFSPDAGQVLFLANRILHAVPVLGGTVQTIAGSACSGAGFSPDGGQIAYIAPTKAGTRLMLAQADGSQPRALADPAVGAGYISQCWDAAGAATHSPAWSPDGRSLALFENLAAGLSRVAVIGTDDGRVRLLGPDLAGAVADVVWRPDGRALLFTASLPVTAQPQLWALSLPGGRLTQLTSDLNGYANSSISAQGAIGLVHADPQYSIWAQSVPGGPFAALPGGGSSQDGRSGLAWTPEGSLVSVRDFNGQSQIWEQSRNGNAAHLLLAAAPFHAREILCAPNGQIVFTGGRPPTLWRANADGSGLVRLLPPPAGGVYPALL
ncbi:MAG: protein kinase domain-containing protein, partial [Terriglobales bacterium]